MNGISKAVVVCHGEVSDPGYPIYLAGVKQQLQNILHTDRDALVVSRLSRRRVTFHLPVDAGRRLSRIAQRHPRSLRSLGISSVQVNERDVVSLSLDVAPSSSDASALAETGRAPIFSGAYSGVGASSVDTHSGSEESRVESGLGSSCGSAETTANGPSTSGQDAPANASTARLCAKDDLEHPPSTHHTHDDHPDLVAGLHNAAHYAAPHGPRVAPEQRPSDELTVRGRMGSSRNNRQSPLVVVNPFDQQQQRQSSMTSSMTSQQPHQSLMTSHQQHQSLLTSQQQRQVSMTSSMTSQQPRQPSSALTSPPSVGAASQCPVGGMGPVAGVPELASDESPLLVNLLRSQPSGDNTTMTPAGYQQAGGGDAASSSATTNYPLASPLASTLYNHRAPAVHPAYGGSQPLVPPQHQASFGRPPQSYYPHSVSGPSSTHNIGDMASPPPPPKKRKKPTKKQMKLLQQQQQQEMERQQFVVYHPTQQQVTSAHFGQPQSYSTQPRFNGPPQQAQTYSSYAVQQQPWLQHQPHTPGLTTQATRSHPEDRRIIGVSGQPPAVYSSSPLIDTLQYSGGGIEPSSSHSDARTLTTCATAAEDTAHDAGQVNEAHIEDSIDAVLRQVAASPCAQRRPTPSLFQQSDGDSSSSGQWKLHTAESPLLAHSAGAVPAATLQTADRDTYLRKSGGGMANANITEQIPAGDRSLPTNSQTTAASGGALISTFTPTSSSFPSGPDSNPAASALRRTPAAGDAATAPPFRNVQLSSHASEQRLNGGGGSLASRPASVNATETVGLAPDASTPGLRLKQAHGEHPTQPSAAVAYPASRERISYVNGAAVTSLSHQTTTSTDPPWNSEQFNRSAVSSFMHTPAAKCRISSTNNTQVFKTNGE